MIQQMWNENKENVNTFMCIYFLVFIRRERDWEREKERERLSKKKVLVVVGMEINYVAVNRWGSLKKKGKLMGMYR